jgi:competence protein ComEC
MDAFLKRPILLFTIAYIAGIVAGLATGSYILSAVLAIPLGAFMQFLIKRRLVLHCFAIAILLFYLFGSFRILFIDNKNGLLYKELDESAVEVWGYVTSQPEIKDNKVSYIIRPEYIAALEGEAGPFYEETEGRILVSTYLNERQKVFEYGSRVYFTGTMYKPTGPRNPGGFDYRRYLAQKGVAARVFSPDIDSEGEGERDEGKKGERKRGSWLVEQGLKIRERIIRTVEASLPPQQAGLLNGILIGYRDGLTKNVQNAFSDAGLTHIMAVSGANVAFIAIPLVFLLKRLKASVPVTNSTIICFLAFFVLITGFEPSVLRAVIMASIVLAGKILRRDSDVISTIFLSALAMLLFEPYLLYNIGFQLSFSATLALVLLFNDVKKLVNLKFLPEKIKDVLAATIAAQLGVLPITLYYFNGVSSISLVTNLLVVPFLEIVTIIGMLMAVLGQIHIGPSIFLGYINCAFLSFILFVVKLSAQVPFAVIKATTPSLAAVALYYLSCWLLVRGLADGSALKFIKTRFKLKHAAFAVALFSLSTIVHYTVPRGTEIVFLDVGQGDCSLLGRVQGSPC